MFGYDAKNKCFVDSKYICPNCALIVRNPLQFTECGHHACQSCVRIEPDTSIQCRECLTQNQANQVMLDRGFQRDMQSFPIECSYCNWIGEINNYQRHLDNTHLNPSCQYCNHQFDTVANLVEHQVVQCEGRVVNCILKDFGCDAPIVCCHMEEHYRSEQHQDALQKLFYRVELQRNNDIHQSTTVQVIDVDGCRWQELCEMLNVPFSGVDILNNSGLERLNNALRLCQLRSPTLTHDFLKAKPSTQENNRSSPRQIHNRIVNTENAATLIPTNDNVQHISSDGTYVWKITDVAAKMVDAQAERQTSIYSPPFYSTPAGYKMRARLYLYGNGDSRRTHMSLFFVLMRGVNDAILTFPFSYRVTFCLYDQTPAHRHIIDSFRPDLRSNSFQRPRTEMNIASGIPKFFPLAMIQQQGNPYIRDDTMFIKIMVDLDNMSRTLLPYAFSLNPGLPAHIQQAMIIQEAERRRRQQTDQISEEENETMSKEEM